MHANPSNQRFSTRFSRNRTTLVACKRRPTPFRGLDSGPPLDRHFFLFIGERRGIVFRTRRIVLASSCLSIPQYYLTTMQCKGTVVLAWLMVSLPREVYMRRVERRKGRLHKRDYLRDFRHSTPVDGSPSPTSRPTGVPSSFPVTDSPTRVPSPSPTAEPTPVPSPRPTTESPTVSPTTTSTESPTAIPTARPSGESIELCSGNIPVVVTLGSRSSATLSMCRRPSPWPTSLIASISMRENDIHNSLMSGGIRVLWN